MGSEINSCTDLKGAKWAACEAKNLNSKMEDGLCSIFNCEYWSNEAEKVANNLEIGPDWSKNKVPLNDERRREVLAEGLNLETGG